MADLNTVLSKFLADLYAGTVGATWPITAVRTGDGSASAPSYSYASDPDTGFLWSSSGIVRFSSNGTGIFDAYSNGLAWASTYGVGWANGALGTTLDLRLLRAGTGGLRITDSTNSVDLYVDAANTLALKNGTNAQVFRTYGYSSGSRSAYGSLRTVVEAVTLSGASTATSNIIPAGATVVDVATTTTTAITGASGYTVGDGTDVDRYGDITGTAVGTKSDSASATADPRWWATTARAITLTAKTSNFTGGVVQVVVYYQHTAAA